MLELLVVVFVGYKCLMPSHIYRGGLPSSRDSREFYNMPRILDIYMCWKCMEYSKIFTSSFVLELPRSFRNWAKLALLVLCWLSSPKLWAIGLVIWADRNTKLDIFYVETMIDKWSYQIQIDYTPTCHYLYFHWRAIPSQSPSTHIPCFQMVEPYFLKDLEMVFALPHDRFL